MKSIVSLSGGLDSSVMLAHILDRKYEVERAISFTYGSKHNQYENAAAEQVAKYYDVPWTLIDLSTAFANFRSALLKTGKPLPQGHYEEDTMRQTVVPFRNGIFLSVLAGLADSLGCQYLFIGAHAGDHFIYPDCRPVFMENMYNAIRLGTDSNVELRTPFIEKTKKDLVAIGSKLNVPFELTRTCYSDQPNACGLCGSCQERLEAFHLNNLEDPLPYQTRELLPKKG
jgi:7-cyano-7-deazaguanine synthase